jgi:flagellar basal body-associated protein FliL
MAAKGTDGANGEGAETKAPPAAGGGGIKAFIPLIVAVVLMPVLSYVLTAFVLLPKLQAGLGITPPAAAASGHGAEGGGHGEAAEGEGEEGEEKAGGHGGGHGAAPAPAPASGGKAREQAPLNKLMVNVAGTAASRILMANIIIVGSSADFKGVVKKHEAQLRDTACGILGTKTIQDLVEKPGARNVIRSELITAFNHVLAGSPVQEIYFTDFAIQ